MSDLLLNPVRGYTQNIQDINPSQPDQLPSNVQWVVIKGEDKFDLLMQLLERLTKPALIFVNTWREVESLTRRIKTAQHSVEGCHRYLQKNTISKLNSQFLEGSLSMLVCTHDMGAAIHHPGLFIVVQYVFPPKLSWILEEGLRVGRSGNPGYSALFFCRRDREDMELRLEAMYPPLAAFIRVIKVLREKWKQNFGTGTEGKLVIPWNRIVPKKYTSESEAFCKSVFSILKRHKIVRTFSILRMQNQVCVQLYPSSSDPVRYFTIKTARRQAYHELDQVEEYIFAPTCRLHSLLTLLRKPIPEPHCGHCDLCMDLQKEWRMKKYDGTLVKTILRCIAELREKFGRTTVVDVLLGKDSKNVRIYGLRDAPSFGSLDGKDRKQLNALIHGLIGDGFISVRRGLYPTLELTNWGWEELKGREIREIQLPKFLDTSFNASFDTGLFESLRYIRTRLAKQKNLPTFQIFPDKILQLMAIHLPNSLEEMGSICGIGSVKLNKFGYSFLEVIHRHREQIEASPFTPPSPSEREDSGGKKDK